MTRAKQRRSLEEAIVDTVREPLVVLDGSSSLAGPSIAHSELRRRKPRVVHFTN
jgi:hypothetical protein